MALVSLGNMMGVGSSCAEAAQAWAALQLCETPWDQESGSGRSLKPGPRLLLAMWDYN